MAIRTRLTGKTALRSLAIVGVAAGAIAPAAGASASRHSSERPNGFSPLIECLNWSGTEQYFPALGSSAKKVTVRETATSIERGSPVPL
jgi:hypothetical protein